MTFLLPPSRLVSLPLALACASWLAAAESGAGAAPPAESEAVAMPALVVKDNALCSFGIGVQAIGNLETKEISRLLITDVWEGSEAEKLGLKAGDEILSINGIKVSALKGGTKRGGDLFELLINRPRGARLKIEVLVHTVKRMTLVAG